MPGPTPPALVRLQVPGRWTWWSWWGTLQARAHRQAPPLVVAGFRLEVALRGAAPPGPGPLDLAELAEDLRAARRLEALAPFAPLSGVVSL